jgi:HD-GYP domain-containing protein (c-di-GMP phosphodiesterase class II)
MSQPDAASTIKPVPIERAVAGMWFHRLGGSGFHHAFVRHSFTLEARDIALLVEGGVTEILIDTAKGLDLPPEPVAVPAETEAATAASAPSGRAPVVASGRGDFALELEAAKRVCAQGKALMVDLFNDARMGKAVTPEVADGLISEITESVSRHPDALISVARLKHHDDYTYLHSVAVAALMVGVGLRLGITGDALRELGMAGMLHDLGKALMPHTVLNKPGALTEEEFLIMKAHPQRGHDMLVEGGGATEVVRDVALHHHEKWDGRGYPHGLAGEAISLPARMGAICDVYDAISSNRPYKKAWGPAESVQRMVSWKGHFDETLFKAFVRTVGIYPVGALVMLESGRLGVVLEQNDGSLLKPRVKVFFNARKKQPLFVKVVDLADPATQDRIVGMESEANWKFPQLEKLWLEQG